MASKAKSLKDRMRAFVVANSRPGGQTCRTCALPKEVLEIVRDLHATGGPDGGPGSNSAIAKALRGEGGHNITSDMLQRHFKLHEKR